MLAKGPKSASGENLLFKLLKNYFCCYSKTLLSLKFGQTPQFSKKAIFVNKLSTFGFPEA